MTYTIRVFDIVDGERKQRGEARMDERIAAEEIFNLLGPYYDVVQLWSFDPEGKPVYRQF